MFEYFGSDLCQLVYPIELGLEYIWFISGNILIYANNEEDIHNESYFSAEIKNDYNNNSPAE